MSGPPINPDLLQLEPGTVHLLCGGEAPLTRGGIAAYSSYAHDKSCGAPGRQRMEAMVEHVRARVAAFVGTRREHVGFLNSASAALVAAVDAIDWRDGDRIVTLADEYPSVVLASQQPQRRGVSVQLVEGGEDPIAALLAALDQRTRLVLVSQVSFRHGRRLDLSTLAGELHRRGVMLGVDASHALGVLPVPVEDCDFVVSCGHKFLLGAHGTGLLFWNAARLGEPQPAVGWFSVTDFAVAGTDISYSRKPGAPGFELGNPDFPALYALDAGLGLLEGAGAEAICRHAFQLSAVLRERLVWLGWEVWTPKDEAHRGTSIAVRSDTSVAIADRLAGEKIYVAAGEGRIRLSVHGFNTMADIDAAIDKLGAP